MHQQQQNNIDNNKSAATSLTKADDEPTSKETALQIENDEQRPVCSTEIVNAPELANGRQEETANAMLVLEEQPTENVATIPYVCVSTAVVEYEPTTYTATTVGYVQVEHNTPYIDGDFGKANSADYDTAEYKNKLNWLPIVDAAASGSHNNFSATEAALAAATSSEAAAALYGMQPKREDMQTQYNGLDFEMAPTPSDSMPSLGSLVCRICHNADNPEQLVSPCLCKGSLSYVHIHCLERWIGTSRCTTCELCQFTYNTEQTLRYTCLQSLRLWYSRAMSRRALQEDCQMFSLLTLVAFGIVGTLLVGIQYYALHTQSWGISKLWTKSWMLFFLFMTITVYFANVYMLIKSQLTPWYRWWQSARDIKLILENRRPFRHPIKNTADGTSNVSMFTHHDLLEMEQQQQQQLQLRTADTELTELTAPLPLTLPASSLDAAAPTSCTLDAYMELHELLLRRPIPLVNPQPTAAAMPSIDKMAEVDDNVNVISTTTTTATNTNTNANTNNNPNLNTNNNSNNNNNNNSSNCAATPVTSPNETAITVESNN